MRPNPIAALAESWGREMDSAAEPTLHASLVASWRDDEREAAAIAKRARRAAKRAEDERRTAAGRAPLWVRLRPRRAFWDWCEWRIRTGSPTAVEPRWRIRSRERRALPGMERPWHARYKGWRNLYTLIRRVGQGRFRALVLRGAL